jgi:hypothetical protein
MNTDSAPTSDRRAQALARLVASRGELQREMSGPHGARDRASPNGLPMIGRWRGRLATWWRYARWQTRSQPLLASALDAAEQWWHHHPWRAPGELALIEIQAQLGPWVKRHPWASVTIAASAGAALMAGRPWRQRWVNRQLQPLPRRMGAWLMAELKRLPLQALLTRVLVAAARRVGQPEQGPDHASHNATHVPPAA